MSSTLTRKQLSDLSERFAERSRQIQAATVDTIQQESPDQRKERIYKLLHPDNYGLMFDYYFGASSSAPMADCASAWYHKAIYRDLYDNEFNTVFNLIFRGGAKSTHANMGYPFALKQAGKIKFVLVVGANQERATMLLQDLQAQFQFNERIIADFGAQKLHGNWTDGTFQTADGCTFMALGIDQPFRGLRANGVRLEYVSIDDVEDKKRSKNPTLTREAIEKVTADIQGAFSTRSERMIVNNNYFVDKGFIYGLAKRKGFDLKKLDTRQNTILREKFASLYIVNLTDRYYADLKAGDWRPSWPERFTRQACLRKIEQYANDVEVLSGEFYNTPINAGKRIKEEWVKMVEPLPLSEYEVLVGNWDMAYGDAACYKAFALIGIKDGHATVLDLFCRQTDIDIAVSYHFRMAKRISKENGACLFYYDAAVAQEAVYEPVWLRAASVNKSFHIPLPQKSITDKYTKIDTTLTSVMPSGTLSFSSRLDNNPDWDEAKRQMLNFEKGSGYPVDFPDSLSDAIIKAQEYLYTNSDDDDSAGLHHKPVIGKRNNNKGY